MPHESLGQILIATYNEVDLGVADIGDTRLSRARLNACMFLHDAAITCTSVDAY